jgi:hypothetical protein
MLLVARTKAPCANEPLGMIDDLPFHNLCYTGFDLHELAPRDSDYLTERMRALHHNSKQGVRPMTKEEQAAERKLAWKMFLNLTTAVFKMNLANVSFPVGFNEQRTLLERSSDLFSFFVTEFINKAHHSRQPEERFGWIVIGVITSFHLCLQQKKPWNPTLGETYVGRWEDGTMIYAEQISHHPPISNVQIRSPNDRWKIDAQFNFEINHGLTQVDFTQKGSTKLVFDNGARYEWEFPMTRILGILKGDRIIKVKGCLRMKDLRNGLEAEVQIGSKAVKHHGVAKPRTTSIWGEIWKIGAKEFISKITRDYARTIYFDGQVMWDLETNISMRPLTKVNDDELLPSYCRSRIDRGYVIQGNEEIAEQAKELLEELQRRDARLRKKLP